MGTLTAVVVKLWFLKILPYKLVGFQTLVILDPYGMTFDAMGVFGLDFWILFKSGYHTVQWPAVARVNYLKTI